MASFLIMQLSSFLFLVLLSSSFHIEARESKFFSKVTHINSNVTEPKMALTASAPPELAPAPAPEGPAQATAPEVPAEEPSPIFYEYQESYGQYGHGSSQLPKSKDTLTTTDFEDDIGGDEKTDGKRFVKGYAKTNLYGNYGGEPSEYNNYEYQVNTNYGYKSSNKDNGYTSNYNANKYNTNGYKESEFETAERQGMSDTRFLENGKYYYNAKDKSNEFSGYESRESSRNEGFYGRGNEYPNEYNSMEEFENQEFVP